MWCTRCEISDRKNVTPVPYRGPIGPAKFVIIGEAPGTQENAEGKPFIGAAGVLLEEALIAAHLDPADAFIMNTVSCYPGGSPPAFAVQACRYHVRAQLNLTTTPYVLLLGKYALNILRRKGDPEMSITRMRGQRIKRKRTYFPTWHPAYVLRNRGEMETFLGDINRFARLISRG